MIRFENVGMRYGAGPEILRDVTFTLETGSCHFLTGPSGAGKSSLLRLLYLAYRPSRGLINVFGQDLATTPREKLPLLRRKIGVVFQDFRLLEHLSAFDNVALPLRISGMPEKDVKKYVTELLDWVGLTHHIKAKPRTLSGGQKQRVAIARAIISRPKLLLADEPTGNVDDEMGVRLMHLFSELNKHGTTVLIATHSQHIIEHFGYPVMHIEDGSLDVPPSASGIVSSRRIED